MKRSLQILSLLVMVSTMGIWIATGSNRGWTKTSVAVRTLDDVTGIEGISYQKKFLPGVDFLAAGTLTAIFLGTGSLFFRKSSPTNNHQTT